MATPAANGRCGAFPGLPFGGLPGYFPFPSMAMPFGYPHPGLPPLMPSPFARPCTDPLCKGCPSMPGAPRFCPIGCPCAGSTGAPSAAGAPDLASMILAASSYNSLLAAHAGLGAFSSMPALSLASTSTPSIDHSTTTTTTANAQRNGHRSHNTANMCNWVSIDGPCLKKFDTAEELMNHLRTHANQVHR